MVLYVTTFLIDYPVRWSEYVNSLNNIIVNMLITEVTIQRLKQQTNLAF